VRQACFSPLPACGLLRRAASECGDRCAPRSSRSGYAGRTALPPDPYADRRPGYSRRARKSMQSDASVPWTQNTSGSPQTRGYSKGETRAAGSTLRRRPASRLHARANASSQEETIIARSKRATMLAPNRHSPPAGRSWWADEPRSRHRWWRGPPVTWRLGGRSRGPVNPFLEPIGHALVPMHAVARLENPVAFVGKIKEA